MARSRSDVTPLSPGLTRVSFAKIREPLAVPDLLGRIRDASATAPCLPREWADWFTRTAMPALLIDGFNLSSLCDAR